MKQWASDLGFDLVGIARAEPLPDHRDHLLNWVEQGRHTGMKWLEQYRTSLRSHAGVTGL